jgi:glutamyl-tRNA synthetase
VFGDILIQGAYFFGDDVPAWDEKAFAKRMPPAVDKLAAYRAWLAARPADAPFDAPSLEAATQAWLAEQGWQLGDIVHAVRVAVTGVAGGPGLFDCLALLGRDICVRRLDRALEKAKT